MVLMMILMGGWTLQIRITSFSVMNWRMSFRLRCADSIDNDGDGLIDSDDLGCASAMDNTETPLWDLANIDNDSDGWIDDLDIICLWGRMSRCFTLVF